MGKACDAMVAASEAVWYWLYPEKVAIPDCLLELLKRLYPTVDWTSVSFHKGIPWFVALGDQKGIVLPASWSLQQIHVYIREDSWDPCTCVGQSIFVHEAFHVLQHRDLLDGWGLDFVRPFLIAYLSCSITNPYGTGNPIETPASAQENKFLPCCLRTGGCSCDCADPSSPTFDAAALDALISACPELVRTSSDFDFWTVMWGCIPGLSALWELATDLTDSACKFDWQPGRDGIGTGWGLPKDLGKAFLRLLAYCAPAFLLSLILRFIGLVYFLVWLVVWFVIVAVIGVIKAAIEVIVIAIDTILWFVTGIVCGAEWLWEQIVGGLQDACDWGTKVQVECREWGEEYREECTETEEQSIKQCELEEDRGHKDCCDWAPCSWLCDAWVWVSNWVCVAWAWVTKTVCVAWSWVKQSVCVAFGWVVTKLTCWSK